MKSLITSAIITLSTACAATDVMPVITPEYRYPVERPISVQMGVDLIVWAAQEDGLSFAVSGYDPSGDTLSTRKGQVYYPGFRFDPGFKINMDIVFPHDGWDTKLEYTWYHMNQTDQQVNSRTVGMPVNGTWNYDFIDLLPTVDQAHGNWKITHEDINWELGRTCSLSHYFHYRPYIGVKGAWQMQHNYVQYQDFFGNDVVLTNLDMTQRFWGVGIRGGTNLTWDLIYCLKIISNTAFSLLSSSFDVSQKYFQPSKPNQLVYSKVGSEDYTITPVIEWQLGLQWGSIVDDGSFGMIIELMYEQQVWWNINHFPRLLTGSNGGALTLQGLTARFGFNF